MLNQTIQRLANSQNPSQRKAALENFLDLHKQQVFAQIDCLIRSEVTFPGGMHEASIDDIRNHELYLGAQDRVLYRVFVPEAFCDVVRSFDPQRAPKKDGFGFWLRVRIRWAIGEFLRDELRQPTGQLGKIDEVSSAPPVGNSTRDTEVLTECLFRYLLKLPARQTAVLLLLTWRATTFPRELRYRAMPIILDVAREDIKESWRSVSCTELRAAWIESDHDYDENLNAGHPGDAIAHDRGITYVQKMFKADQHQQAKFRYVIQLLSHLDRDSSEYETELEALRSECQQVLNVTSEAAAGRVFSYDESTRDKLRKKFHLGCHKEKKALQEAQNKYNEWMRTRASHLLNQKQLANILGFPVGTIESDLTRARNTLREFAEESTDAGRLFLNIFPQQGQHYQISDQFTPNPDIDMHTWIAHRVCKLDEQG